MPCETLLTLTRLTYRRTMPSSFEGKYGSTRYWLRAELRRIRQRHESKTKRTIIFINPLNITLNEYQVMYWKIRIFMEMRTFMCRLEFGWYVVSVFCFLLL